MKDNKETDICFPILKMTRFEKKGATFAVLRELGNDQNLLTD